MVLQKEDEALLELFREALARVPYVRALRLLALAKASFEGAGEYQRALDLAGPSNGQDELSLSIAQD